MSSNQSYYHHKNIESDTVHGHNTFLTEMKMVAIEDHEHLNHNDNVNKVCADYAERETQKENEIIARKAEYRDYLLQQIKDKVKKDSYRQGTSSMTPFSEEMLNASEKKDLKLQRQRETKQYLDDCVKMKQDMKMKTQRTEIEEEQKRTDFWKKQADDNDNILEKAKQQTERKEHKKNEVALLWMAEKRIDVQRDKYMDGLIEKESITDFNNHHDELIETQKSIRIKRELFDENEEKINELLETVEIFKREQEKLKEDIKRDEELEQKLAFENEAIENLMVQKSMDEADQTKRVLQERNYQCANDKFFGISN